MKTLIAYATKGGVTGDSAYAIADVLRQLYGFDVDVHCAVQECHYWKWH